MPRQALVKCPSQGNSGSGCLSRKFLEWMTARDLLGFSWRSTCVVTMTPRGIIQICGLHHPDIVMARCVRLSTSALPYGFQPGYSILQLSPTCCCCRAQAWTRSPTSMARQAMALLRALPTMAAMEPSWIIWGWLLAWSTSWPPCSRWGQECRQAGRAPRACRCVLLGQGSQQAWGRLSKVAYCKWEVQTALTLRVAAPGHRCSSVPVRPALSSMQAPCGCCPLAALIVRCFPASGL